MESLTSYEQFVREKDLCLKKSFYERNKCLLEFHKKLAKHFLTVVEKIETGYDNLELIKDYLHYITPFAIDSDDIFFGLQTSLRDLVMDIDELLIDAIESQQILEIDKIRKIKSAIQQELQDLSKSAS